MHQGRRLLQAQPCGHGAVGDGLQASDDAALRVPGLPHGGEQAVERAAADGDRGLGDLALPAPRRGEEPRLAQLPQGLAHGVPRDRVLLHQRELAGEGAGELAAAEAALDVCLHLDPQRRTRGAVDAR